MFWIARAFGWFCYFNLIAEKSNQFAKESCVFFSLLLVLLSFCFSKATKSRKKWKKRRKGKIKSNVNRIRNWKIRIRLRHKLQKEYSTIHTKLYNATKKELNHKNTCCTLTMFIDSCSCSCLCSQSSRMLFRPQCFFSFSFFFFFFLPRKSFQWY